MTDLAEHLDGPQVVARVPGPRGELVLRRAGAHFEIISNGVFLMDTRSGRSERLLVRAALAATRADGEVLIGGLGVGFSLDEAVRSPVPRRITVVELERAIVDWHDGPLRPFTAAAFADPRVRLVNADVIPWLTGTDGRFAAICLDIDNGPDWTVTPDNAALYSAAGLRLLRSRLAPGGALAVWSAARSASFEQRLGEHLADLVVSEVGVRRGEPDVIYVGRA